MADFVAVPIAEDAPDERSGEGPPLVLFETAEADLVELHGGRPDVGELAAGTAGHLEAIGAAAEQVYRSLRARLQPDTVEMEISIGLSGEVGWFVAKSSASGSLKLKLAWKPEPPAEPGTPAEPDVRRS
ncbi:hypothetical protein SAMN05421678_1184 [Actinopolymorpha cephalotaxi]|nr:CU044_2847 family protein [Actinopolymorpha cephalotaxi]SFH44232.1 hypothetical protein SAMN05421678_1184 [Actinopolymorpha cephalotaxi]